MDTINKPSEMLDQEETQMPSEEIENKVSPVDTNALETKDNESLLSLAKELVNGQAIQSIKTEIETIKRIYFDRLHQAQKEELASFIEAGGNEIDFKFDYPLKDAFKEVLNTYKDKKRAERENQERELNTNLKEKLAIIEELKSLVNSEEKMSETFEHFKDIQKRWKAIGYVPQKDTNNVWNTYHHHVECFFDYIKINNELRDIEFKRNLDKKLQLCEAAEALVAIESIDDSFNELQKLHTSWKEETGPVPKEHRETVWERFQTATKLIHKRRNDHFLEQKAVMEENFQKKLALCEKVEAMSGLKFEHHSDWQDKIKEINGIREEWQKIGRISKEQNEESWERFITAIKHFNHNKNEFYKHQKEQQKDAIKIKTDIWQKAEALKESTDWKTTADQLKRLQQEWKSSPNIGRKQADKIWESFRAACNHFFDRRTQYFEEQDKAFEGNLDAKKVIIEALEKFELTEDTHANFEALKAFSQQWKECGKVPRKHFEEIENKFRSMMDTHFNELRMEEKEKNELRFKMKMENLFEQGDRDKIKDEAMKIRKRIDTLQKELNVYENNILFFKGANNPMLKDAEKKIDAHKKSIDALKANLKTIRSMS